MSTEVSVDTGRLRGVAAGTVVSFRGIPYARAARFAAPEPAEPWSGVRDASLHGPRCPQPRSPFAPIMGEPEPEAPQSEDCLTLTITAPAAPAAPRPVMVWLHGGAYLIGAGSLLFYDGSALADEGDVIVVGVNYRLGAFGYLHWPGVSEPNLGLRDQLLALRWVQRNIAAFGGDPERVTVFGQSAGGHSVAALLSMPETRGLFQRAIIQSAHLGVGFTSRARAARVRRQLERALAGADPRSCPPQQLLAAQEQMRLRLAGPLGLNPTPAFGPIAGMAPLTAAGRITDLPASQRPEVPLIIGTTRDELRSLLEVNPRWRALRTRHGLGERFVNGFSEVVGRRTFDVPAQRLADRLVAAGGTAFTYRLDYRPPGGALGSCHTIDLPFVFGGRAAWEHAPMLCGDWQSVEPAGAELRRAWTGFAHTGDPNLEGTPAWPKHRPGAAVGRRF